MVRGALIAGFSAVGLLGGAAHAQPEPCLALSRPLATGAFVTPDAVHEAPCHDERPRAPLRYDRRVGAPIATQELPEGTYLGAIVLKPGTIARPGEPLTLVIRSGPVTIARIVRPLVAVRSGNRALVRTDDGQTISARFVAAEGTS